MISPTIGGYITNQNTKNIHKPRKTITVLMYNNPNDFKSVASKTKLIKKNEEIKTIIHFCDFNPLSEIRPVIYKFAHKRNISYIYILIIISHEQYRLYI
jgi:hypothetical protein